MYRGSSRYANRRSHNAHGAPSRTTTFTVAMATLR